jgi:hypothetical protein
VTDGRLGGFESWAGPTTEPTAGCVRLPLGAWGATEAVPKLSEEQEAFLREFLQRRGKVKRLREQVNVKDQERGALTAEQGEQASVKGKSKSVEERSDALLRALPTLNAFYSALPAKVPELCGPAAGDKLRAVLAVGEPSDGEEESRDYAALLDLQLTKEVGSREDPGVLTAFERADFGEAVKEVFQTARGRLRWVAPFGSAPNPAPDRREPRGERQQSPPASQRTSSGSSDTAATVRETTGRQPKEYGKHQDYPKFRGGGESAVADFYLRCAKVEFALEQNSVPEARRLFRGSRAWAEGSPAKGACELCTAGQAEAVGGGGLSARSWRGACECVRRTLYGAETDSLESTHAVSCARRVGRGMSVRPRSVRVSRGTRLCVRRS